MTDNKRKRQHQQVTSTTATANTTTTNAAMSAPAKAKSPPFTQQTKPQALRSNGFVTPDQRLPASPPLANAPPTIMTLVRRRCNNALHMLFGSQPIVLNQPCNLPHHLANIQNNINPSSMSRPARQPITVHSQQQTDNNNTNNNSNNKNHHDTQTPPPSSYAQDTGGGGGERGGERGGGERGGGGTRFAKRRRTIIASDQVVPDSRHLTSSHMSVSSAPSSPSQSSDAGANHSLLSSEPSSPQNQYHCQRHSHSQQQAARLPTSHPSPPSTPVLTPPNVAVTAKRDHTDRDTNISFSPHTLQHPHSNLLSQSQYQQEPTPQQEQPNSPQFKSPLCDEERCVCANSMWTSNGIGPKLMLRTAEELADTIIRMYGRGIDLSTNDIDYAKLSTSIDFRRYLSCARKLRYFDPLLLNEIERKAFFLNVYNSLMIHAITAISKPRTMFDRVSLYNTASYNIGGRAYTLNMIEHGVLRANKCGNGPFAQSPFAVDDARRLCSLPSVDPRIHFALNCGAKSCPPVRFYEANNLDSALDAATTAYLLDIEVDDKQRKITLPKLLQWYNMDFCHDGTIDTVLKWTLPYLQIEKRTAIETLLREKQLNGKSFRVVYAPYDWTVNDSSGGA